MKVYRQRLLIWIALAAIVALAAYARLERLDQVEFRADEAWTSEEAMLVAHDHYFPLVGSSASVGISHGPLLSYVMAIPYLFTSDPALATGFIGLLGVLAVIACYQFSRTYFGELAALIASLLFAVSPWAIMFSRKIFQPFILTPLVILLMWALYSYAVKRRTWQLPIACLVAGLATQAHLSAVALIPLTLLVVLLFRRPFRWTALALGVCLGALTVIPYLVNDAARGWAIFRFVANWAGTPSAWNFSSAGYVFDMVARQAGYAATVPGDAWVYGIEGWMFILGLAYVLVRLAFALRARNRESSAKLTLLILWLGVPVLVFSRQSIFASPNYLLQVLPAQFIVIGILLSDINLYAVPYVIQKLAGAPWQSLALKVSVIGSAFLIIALGFVQFSAFQSFLDGLAVGNIPVGYGLPLKYSVRAMEMVREFGAAEPGRPVYVAGDGKNFESSFNFLAHGQFYVHHFDGNTSLVLPPPGQGQFVYVIVNAASAASQFIESNFPQSKIATAGDREGGLVSAAYRIDSDEVARSLEKTSLHSLPFTVPSGVEFLGWQMPHSVRAGENLVVTWVWRAVQPNADSGKGYSFFSHLVDSQGRVWGGDDSEPYYPTDRQAGEVILNWQQVRVSTAAPLAKYWIALGMYDHDGVRRLPITSNIGSTQLDALMLGPLKVVPSIGLPQVSDAMIQNGQKAWLGDAAQLLGYNLNARAMRPGEALELTLHWLAGSPGEDFTVFVHLVDEDGHLVAQADSQPQAGNYPTSLWDKGEYVSDEHSLVLPADLALGTYRLEVGMYLLRTGQRLQVRNKDGQTAGDAIELEAPIKIGN